MKPDKVARRVNSRQRANARAPLRSAPAGDPSSPAWPPPHASGRRTSRRVEQRTADTSLTRPRTLKTITITDSIRTPPIKVGRKRQHNGKNRHLRSSHALTSSRHRHLRTRTTNDRHGRAMGQRKCGCRRMPTRNQPTKANADQLHTTIATAEIKKQGAS